MFTENFEKVEVCSLETKNIIETYVYERNNFDNVID